MRTTLSALIVVSACGKASEPPPAKQPPVHAASASSFEHLTVKLEGKRIPIDRAFIKRSSPDAYILQLGHLQGSCEELLTGNAERAPGGTSFALAITKRVAPSGHEKYVVSDFWSRDIATRPELGGTVRLGGEPTEGLPGTIELPRLVDVAAPRTDARLEVSGTLTAIGCGDRPTTGMGTPKAAHASKATITIAGKRVPLAGAILSAPDVVFSTSPKDCSQVTLAAPVILERARGRWRLSGTWFEQPVENTATPDPDTAGLAFGARGVGLQSADGPVIELVLSGRGSVGGYPVTLEGTIDAIECTP